MDNKERTSSYSGKIYTSPQRKLVTFFEKSRDQWKAKCRDAKAVIKRLKNRVRSVEHSREQWKQKALALESQLVQVQADLAASSPDVDALKKTHVAPKNLQRG